MEKAVILAAGRGTRMGSLTQELPKPMLSLAGRPILEHVIERLRSAGFSKFAVVVGYRHEVIEEHFAGQGIQFLLQENPNGTAKAALLAREFVGQDDFLLTFGDILAESSDYAAMAAQMENDPSVVAVGAVRWCEDPYQGAAVYEQGGIVTSIIEKPPKGTSSTNWNSAGIYCCRSTVFEELARVPLSVRGEYELTSAVEAVVASGRVRIHSLDGIWRDIGRPEDLAAAQAEI